jgi:hypothetical protein
MIVSALDRAKPVGEFIRRENLTTNLTVPHPGRLKMGHMVLKGVKDFHTLVRAVFAPSSRHGLPALNTGFILLHRLPHRRGNWLSRPPSPNPDMTNI